LRRRGEARSGRMQAPLPLSAGSQLSSKVPVALAILFTEVSRVLAAARRGTLVMKKPGTSQGFCHVPASSILRNTPSLMTGACRKPAGQLIRAASARTRNNHSERGANMKRTRIIMRLALILLFCLGASAGINPASAAAGDRHDRECHRRCDEEYRRRKDECHNERGRERHRCEDRANREHKDCKHSCR